MMQHSGLSGQRVLLVCKSQKNFVIAFYACMLAEAVAIPTAPPRHRYLLNRLQLIAQDAQAQAIVFDYDELWNLDAISDKGSFLKVDIRLCAGDADRSALAARRLSLHRVGGATAFLQ